MSLTVDRVPVTDLRQFPGNPRRGDVDAIAASLQRLGQYRPIVVRRATNEVLAGNHTLQAAVRLGWDAIDVTYVDADEQQARAIVAADNRLADLGSYDDEDLANLLQSIDDQDLRGATGYHEDDLRELLASLEPPFEPQADPEDAPDAPAVPVTQLGDLWRLGEHVLVCGDSTDPAVVARAMGGSLADMAWSDPPYGVDYVGKTADKLTIAGDTAKGLLDLLVGAFAGIAAALRPGSPWYLAAPPGPLGTTFRVALGEAGLPLHQVLVWVKDQFVLGHSDYHYRHEDVLYGFTPGPGRSGRGNHDGSRWLGDHASATVFEIPRPRRSEVHPTMKPVALIVPMITNSCPLGGTVFDPFAGSGSTLVAAHTTGRRAVCIELAPAYCDVIVQRWEGLTGETADREQGTSAA